MEFRDILEQTALTFYEVGETILEDITISKDWNDDSKMRVSLNCSDVFAWGSADFEEITEENLPVLKQTAQDLLDINGAGSAATIELSNLFAARVRGQRPQGAYLAKFDKFPKDPPFFIHGGFDKVKELYRAVGPERGIDLFNPQSESGEYLYSAQ
jgi:hypothetical protein